MFEFNNKTAREHISAFAKVTDIGFSLKDTLRNIPKLNLFSWCGLSTVFPGVETLRKLFASTKFPHQEIR